MPSRERINKLYELQTDKANQFVEKIYKKRQGTIPFDVAQKFDRLMKAWNAKH